MHVEFVRVLCGFAEPNHGCVLFVWQALKQVYSLGD